MRRRRKEEALLAVYASINAAAICYYKVVGTHTAITLITILNGEVCGRNKSTIIVRKLAT